MEINKEVEAMTDTLAVYEVSYLLLPSLAQEQAPLKAVVLKETLTSLGGAVISDEDPVLIDLAYPMLKVVTTVRHKVNTGYFGWIKFEITPQGIEKIKKTLDADANIVRYIIIRTVRENTLLNGKMKFQKEEKVRKVDDIVDNIPEVSKEVVSEDLDKNIDDLVIV
ncbi:MAG: 30S ribosomal protein S6 [Minisyncoccia bacterium]